MARNNIDNLLKDLIAEADVMRITGYSKKGLAKLRKEGELRWTSLKGKKIIYFKSDLAQKLNLNVFEENKKSG